MKNLKSEPAILLVGIGNNGRGDDGLGWEFVERIAALGVDCFDYEFRYQLQVEDAAMIGDYDIVIFVDSSKEKLSGGFKMSRCISASHSFFSTHSQAPSAILHLANSLYSKFPKAYTLVISGKEWDVQTSLSTEARKNLESALSFFIGQFLPSVQPKMVLS
jgi:hydrogenase maturation protease